ncbi:DUF4035 domain-containing protein [Polynucleobacter paneuropaeus]|nr:DUF4035 domain-containing protein [Polynucleobacter paneuropaeus]QWD55884.1 DUF4035 domain-containing protein [Polynucleobacter paneuropaeus]
MEPDADSRADYLSAQTLALLNNVHRDPEKSEPAFPIDFMPWSQEAKEEEKPKESPQLDVKSQVVRLKALFSKKGK